MPWCPKCKNEYVEGITVCADCGCRLVDSLDSAEDELSCGEAAECDVPLAEPEAVIEGMPQYGESLRCEADFEGVYEDSGKKAEEFKSGAYTLLGVGVMGLAVLALLISGALPIRLNPSSQWMTCLVMGALFIVFIVMGAQSMQSAKRLSEKGKKEASLKEELEQYCRDNLTAASIDEAAGILDSDVDEMRYFKRTERMKSLLAGAFSDLESGYLDHFVDEIYPRIFEQ